VGCLQDIVRVVNDSAAVNQCLVGFFHWVWFGSPMLELKALCAGPYAGGGGRGLFQPPFQLIVHAGLGGWSNQF
jgi:hypothetical protein